MFADNGSTDYIPWNVVLLFVNMLRHHASAVVKDLQERENNMECTVKFSTLNFLFLSKTNFIATLFGRLL